MMVEGRAKGWKGVEGVDIGAVEKGERPELVLKAEFVEEGLENGVGKEKEEEEEGERREENGGEEVRNGRFVRKRRRRVKVGKEKGRSNHALGMNVQNMNKEEVVQLVGSIESWEDTPLRLHASLEVGSVWIAGRYCKLVRGISQTDWKAKGVKTSVEEVIREAVLPVFGGESMVFTAGGREDVDVRMLGSGRPFVVEIKGGKFVGDRITGKELDAITEKVNHGENWKGLVEVKGLKVVDRGYYSEMSKVENEKRKHYRCIIWTDQPQNEKRLQNWVEEVNKDGGIVLEQNTPLRVLHRRTLMVRKKQIWKLDFVKMNSESVFVLDVEAAAGTYIKEFVHSDLGRTQPNVGSMLGCQADILQLDVMGIQSEL